MRSSNITQEINSYLKRLFPLNRSITGDSNRDTLKILEEIVPLKIIEYPSGQQAYDWTIPKEWNIRDAWIKNSKGEKIVDFQKSNLHVVSYSTPICQKIKWGELKEHLHYLEELPDAIPYRTSYYHEDWGFCLPFSQFSNLNSQLSTLNSQLSNSEFEVFIDSELKDGSLSIGELLISGKSKKEYLISCYICHPSMANDSLSGVITTAYLARYLLEHKDELEHSYRIIFVPETIGAITYCANNEVAMKQIDTGLVITTCGGHGRFGYKQSWDASHEINQMVEDVFRKKNIDYITYPFDIHGSDERQYSSQGFRINCVSITKDKYYEYPEYHTSLDNLDFVKPEYINESLQCHIDLVELMDKNIIYKNLYLNCEVMLSKHDLYPKTGGALLPNSEVSTLDVILWILFYADGTISSYNIAEKLGVPPKMIYAHASRLEEKNILKRESDG